MSGTYKIVRFFANEAAPGHRKVLRTGLALEEAQAHCTDPQTSSRTATTKTAVALTRRWGAWFDGYQEEK